MKRVRIAAAVTLAALFAAALFAEQVAPYSYDEQFRDAVYAGPSERFPLGTDALGRDRLSRLLYGTRITLLMTPAAAALSVLLAALAGAAAGYLGGWFERCAAAVIDLFLSLPWLFLLLAVRAALPLNTDPLVSVASTLALLACLGWAGPARTICTAARAFRGGDLMLQAQAMGMRPLRLFVRQLLPALRPLLVAQFWVALSLFVLSEANLGVLGLGVAEPTPSWGNLLRELQDLPAVAERPLMLAPAALLVAALCSIQLVSAQSEES